MTDCLRRRLTAAGCSFSPHLAFTAGYIIDT
ncbi:hypothetical protein L195_g051295, partial [Trifolium pratense]